MFTHRAGFERAGRIGIVDLTQDRLQSGLDPEDKGARLLISQQPGGDEALETRETPRESRSFLRPTPRVAGFGSRRARPPIRAECDGAVSGAVSVSEPNTGCSSIALGDSSLAAIEVEEANTGDGRLAT